MGNEPSKSTGNRGSHEAPPVPSLLISTSEGTSEHRSQGTQWRQGAPGEWPGQHRGAASQVLSVTSCVTSGKSTAHVHCPHRCCSQSGLSRAPIKSYHDQAPARNQVLTPRPRHSVVSGTGVAQDKGPVTRQVHTAHS